MRIRASKTSRWVMGQSEFESLRAGCARRDGPHWEERTQIDPIPMLPNGPSAHSLNFQRQIPHPAKTPSIPTPLAEKNKQLSNEIGFLPSQIPQFRSGSIFD